MHAALTLPESCSAPGDPPLSDPCPSRHPSLPPRPRPPTPARPDPAVPNLWHSLDGDQRVPPTKGRRTTGSLARRACIQLGTIPLLLARGASDWPFLLAATMSARGRDRPAVWETRRLHACSRRCGEGEEGGSLAGRFAGRLWWSCVIYTGSLHAPALVQAPVAGLLWFARGSKDHSSAESRPIPRGHHQQRATPLVAARARARSTQLVR